MKKLVALVLALALCLGVALAETVDFIGVWYMNEIGDGETTLNPASLGWDVTMTLNANGTATADFTGEVAEGTWAIDGESIVVTIDDEALYLTLADGNLVAEVSGTIMGFGREKVEVEIFTPGAALTDATMADYNGVWNASLVDVLGMQFPVADMGMPVQLTIADGKVTVLEGEGEDSTSDEGDVTLENGALSMTLEDNGKAMPLQLHEGDVLALTADLGDDMSMIIYFEKAAE